MGILIGFGSVPSFLPARIELDNLPSTILWVLADPTSFEPFAGFRANSNGEAEKAQGSTQAPIVWTRLGDDWLINGERVSASDYEIKAIQISANGAAVRSGTVDAWMGLGSTRRWTINKTGTGIGDTNWELDIEIREIADPSNTTGVHRVDLQANIIP